MKMNEIKETRLLHDSKFRLREFGKKLFQGLHLILCVQTEASKGKNSNI